MKSNIRVLVLHTLFFVLVPMFFKNPSSSAESLGHMNSMVEQLNKELNEIKVVHVDM